MDKKKILIISRSFYPQNSPRAIRATELAKEFAKQGHDVRVLIHLRDPYDGDFSKRHNIQVEDFVQNNYKQIKGKSIILRGFRILLNYLFVFPEIQYIWLLNKYLNKLSGYDLLISLAYPYPVHWAVAIARKKNNKLCKVWVADCGDPFMGNKEKKNGLPFYFEWIENWFCKKPDYLTVPIKEAVKAYPALCREKIKVIPQGFNFEEIRKLSKQPENLYPHFAYAGILGINVRNPEKFLIYLGTKSELKFKFIIYTNSPEIVEPYKSLLGEKLELHNYIPREQVLQELSKMDFLVNFENKNTVQSPSKLIEYALLEKPILSVQHNDLNTAMIDEFLKRDYTNRLLLENITQYDIKKVTTQFLTLSENGKVS